MADNFRHRQYIIQGVFLLLAIALIIPCFRLQLTEGTFQEKARSTAVGKITIYPARGLVTDRHHKLLVNNKAMYDLMVTYKEVKDIDTLKFCNLLGISVEEFEERLNKDFDRDFRFSRSKPFAFMKKIPIEMYARFQESMYEFPGFFAQLRNVRNYPYRVGAHVLGYLREVNRQEISVENSPYQRGDYIGVQGLEYAYEEELRGKKGAKYVLKNNLGRIEGAYKNGERDIPAESGMTLVTGMDGELQAYGEKLMRNKRGSVVAIEPKTGDILAMLSTPTYDPNLLTINKNRGHTWKYLVTDTLKPLFDRSIRAEYPPGSIFKTVMSLISMQEGIWSANRGFGCGGGYNYGGSRKLACHGHIYPSSVKVALQHSCNSYYCEMFRKNVDRYGYKNPYEGLDTLVSKLTKFGLGKKLNVDLYDEKKGNIPDAAYYNRIYSKEKGSWRSPTIISVSIGQGEVQMTTLQMANLAAIIANKGYYYQPHLAKYFVGEDRVKRVNQYPKHTVGVEEKYFQPVIDGMELAVLAGTAPRAKIKDIEVCGKTGTSENSGTDHSVFFAFAPKDDPKIAIAVFVENAGFGGTYAAPIASLMIEKYLKGDIDRDDPLTIAKEKRILDTDLLGAD